MPNKAFVDWRQARNNELAAPESWLGLVGLFWLEPGVNSVGSGAEAAIRLPSGPARAGDLRWEEGRVFWHADHAPGVELQPDTAGQPDTVDIENLTFFVVDRDGRLAVRLRDREWAVRSTFNGLGYFSYDPAWRIEADWQLLTAPLRMEVPNMSGDLKQVEVTHQAVFTADGQVVNLLPMSVSDKEIFFVFRDRTSGRETYGAGRFLKVPVATMETKAGPRVDGKISLDFNFAYNPPCAFTPFATCPLPPPENWLPFAVPAGEKQWIKAT